MAVRPLAHEVRVRTESAVHLRDARTTGENLQRHRAATRAIAPPAIERVTSSRTPVQSPEPLPRSAPPSSGSLIEKLGLAPGSQMAKLVAAVAGSQTTLSAVQFAAAMLSPKTAAQVTSHALQDLSTHLYGKTGGVSVSALPASSQLVAKLVAGSRATITQDDLQIYLGSLKAKFTNGVTAIPNSQRVAVVHAQLANLAGNKHMLVSKSADGEILFRGAYVSSYLRALGAPECVGFWQSATDLKIRNKLPRADAFRSDPGLVAEYGDRVAIDPDVYNNSGFDMGHQADRESGVDGQAQHDSYQMSNMAPQTKQLNQQSWRTLETGLRQLFFLSGAAGPVKTGPLYLDANKKPLAQSKLSWIDKPAGTHRVAIGTHSFKSALMYLPSGELARFQWVVPNTTTLPTDKAGIAKLLRESMVSDAQLDDMVGFDLYPGVTGRHSDFKAALSSIPKAQAAGPHPALSGSDVLSDGISVLWDASIPKPAYIP